MVFIFTKWCLESQTVRCTSIKIEHTLSPYTKLNSKWLKDLDIKHGIMTLLDGNIDNTFSDILHTVVF